MVFSNLLNINFSIRLYTLSLCLRLFTFCRCQNFGTEFSAFCFLGCLIITVIVIITNQLRPSFSIYNEREELNKSYSLIRPTEYNISADLQLILFDQKLILNLDFCRNVEMSTYRVCETVLWLLFTLANSFKLKNIGFVVGDISRDRQIPAALV